MNENNIPAFPLYGGFEQLDSNLPVQGMSLRDYFAARAMQGYLNECYDMDHTSRARFSYEPADAMLKARQQ